MELQAILERLADGEFHSGEVLGELLGVSRTAVWKHLQKLEDIGIALESVRGKGYRLPGGIELLNKATILAELRPPARQFLRQMDLQQSVESTNTLAMQHAAKSGAHGYVCLAEHQLAGRGRRGRQWVSPFGQNLYLSAVVEFDGGAAALEGLSLAVGVALLDALAELGASEIGLKWPNDVLWDGRKLAGILLEMTGDPAGACSVVVGLGINVQLSGSAASSIDQPWAQLREVLPKVSRNRLAAAVLNHLLPLLGTYQEKGFVAYRSAWEAAHVYANRAVTLSTVQHRFEGVALGVTNSGALRVDLGDRIEEFNGGEVSLRAMQPDSPGAQQQ